MILEHSEYSYLVLVYLYLAQMFTAVPPVHESYNAGATRTRIPAVLLLYTALVLNGSVLDAPHG